MRNLIQAATIAILAAQPLHAQDWATIETFGGAWDTNWGEVWVIPNEYGYEGSYAEDNGVFGLEFDGHVFVGFWVEDMADVECATPFNGSYYWGRLQLANSDTYPGIEMLWGYFDTGRVDKVWSFYERLPDGL